jgi:hypothetical protein
MSVCDGFVAAAHAAVTRTRGIKNSVPKEFHASAAIVVLSSFLG